MSEHKRCGCVEQYHDSDCPACRGTGLIPPVICDEWNSARDELSALRSRVAELEADLADADEVRTRRCNELIRDSNDYARMMEQRINAAEARASAAVEAHAQLLSRIAADGTLDVMERAVAAESRAKRLEGALEDACELMADARYARAHDALLAALAASESEVSHG